MATEGVPFSEQHKQALRAAGQRPEVRAVRSQLGKAFWEQRPDPRVRAQAIAKMTEGKKAWWTEERRRIHAEKMARWHQQRREKQHADSHQG